MSHRLLRKISSKFAYNSNFYGGRNLFSTINTNIAIDTSNNDRDVKVQRGEGYSKRKNDDWKYYDWHVPKGVINHRTWTGDSNYKYLLEGIWNLQSKSDVDALMRHIIEEEIPDFKGLDHNDLLDFTPLLNDYFDLNGKWIITPKKSNNNSKEQLIDISNEDKTLTGENLLSQILRTDFGRKKHTNKGGLNTISNLLEPDSIKKKVKHSKPIRVLLPHGHLLRKIYRNTHVNTIDMIHRTAADLGVHIDNKTIRVYIPHDIITEVIVLSMFQNFEPLSIQTLDVQSMLKNNGGSDMFSLRHGGDYLVRFPSEELALLAAMKFNGQKIVKASIYITHYDV